DMARRRHADFGALAGDVAVHGVDLGAPAFPDVLRHRRALDIAARVRVGLGHEERLDFGERSGVALGSPRHGFRFDAADLLELVADRLSDAHGFAGEPDLEAPDRIVAQAVAGSQARGRRDGVAHRVLHQLRPALAPEVGGRLRAVDRAEPPHELLDPRRDAAVRLADAENRVLVAAFRDRPADAPRFVQVDRDERSDRAERAAPADYAGDRLFVEAVLQRQGEALLGEVGRDERGRPAGVVGLDRDHRDIDGVSRQGLHFGQVKGFRLPDDEFLLRRDAVELQAARPDGFHMLRPRIDERDVVPKVGERAADIASQRSRPDDCNAFCHRLRAMILEPLAGALGAEVRGVALADLQDEAAWQAIRRAFLRYSVLVFRDQGLEPADLMRVGGRFGEPCFYPFVTGLDGYPHIFEVVKEEQETTNFGGNWHSDTTYLAQPPLATLLQAI